MTAIVTKSNFFRPANTTAYADNDLVANDVDAADVVPLIFSMARLHSGRGSIKRVRFWKDSATATAAIFTLHLFESDPSVNVGDNAQLDNSGTLAVDTMRDYIGSITMDASTGGNSSANTDLAKQFAVSNPITFDVSRVQSANRRLYGLLEAGGAYAPASGEEFEISLEVSDAN